MLENVEDQHPGNIWRPFTRPVTATSNDWPCSMCSDSFPRRQERDRHELAHLPFFLHCPVAGCLWRGNRQWEFQRHWQQKDPNHRSGRKLYGCTPEQSLIETFDPMEILDRIKNGAITLTEGQEQAILMVQVKSFELQKLDMMTHPWGRNRRQ